MLIDEFLPVYDEIARHQIDIHGSAERVYAAARKLDLSGSAWVRWLFRLRGFPALFFSRAKSRQEGLGLTLDGLLKSGFILLGETPPGEIVLGLVGKFWTSSGCIQRLDKAGFLRFATPDYAKAVWNFSLSPQMEGITRLFTETRVLCLDESSRKRFRFCWVFIRPFSGLIRMEALRAIKRQAEDAAIIR
ncbi:hypothetical protein L0337_25390 [candidate division KSB1 bacterium]|nr:hypothetical protein [candidate division KSB1 bacterium]